jgi:hypothetical protein
MANKLFGQGLFELMDNTLDLEDGTIAIRMVDGAQTNLAGADWVDDLDTGYTGEEDDPWVGPAVNLASKAITGNAFDAADTDIVVGADQDGRVATGLIIYRDSGDPSTSPLLAYIDNAVGFPYTAGVAGETVTIAWDNGANKIFKLVNG